VKTQPVALEPAHIQAVAVQFLTPVKTIAVLVQFIIDVKIPPVVPELVSMLIVAVQLLTLVPTQPVVG
jgi:hypothetical protein